MDRKIPLSVAIITKNEERNIRECLRSVAFASDIVVVDSGSTDATTAIASETGCRLFIEDWKGHGPQKMSAIDKCRFDWTLIVDGDERIPEATAREIARCLEEDDGEVSAFSFRRKNFFHGKWIKQCGWWPDEVIRLVRKSQGRLLGLVHDKWRTEGRIRRLTAHIEHYSFTKYDDLMRIMTSRAVVMAQDLFDSGRRVGVATPVLHGLGMFLKTYIFRSGFLAGFDGLVISLARAGGTFLKYANLLELQRTQSGARSNR